MSYTEADIKKGLRHLKKVDPVMKELIPRIGPFTLELHKQRFDLLVRSILSQQISTAAARAVRTRLNNLLKPKRVTPPNIAALSQDELRAVGLSRQKSSYLHDLADKVASKDVRLSRTHTMTDDEVIAELVQVKGIGVWTAQMFLIFALGRLDVFPYDDLGVRASMRDLYELDELPKKKESEEIAASWRPYATLGSWYLWRHADAKSNPTAAEENGYPV